MQKNGRHRGTRSQSHHYATNVGGRFEKQSRATPQQLLEGFEDPIYDELSRTANYQSSKSALGGYGDRGAKISLNKTQQVGNNAVKIQKVNLKKNQIKFTAEGNAPTENPTTKTGEKSVSREGRLKVKLQTNSVRMSHGLKVAPKGAAPTSQSPKMSRNNVQQVNNTASAATNKG